MKAVLFDMDGVLVDSEPVINKAAILGLAEYGVYAASEDFIPFVGAGEDRYIGGVAEKYGLKYKPEMKKRVYEIYLDIVDGLIKPFDGALELLSFLRSSGVKIALASSADMIKINANLRAARIPLDMFDAIVCGEDAANKKPAPDTYLIAARKLNVEPSRCVVIEDAVNGVMSAKAAQMRCIAVTSSFPQKELEQCNPDFICKDLKEIHETLKKLLKGA